MSIFVAVVLLPFCIRLWKAVRSSARNGEAAVVPPHTLPFPWWGYAGAAAALLFWTLAWTRFPWFARFQQHTFTPLWISYIVVVNAVTYRRSGSCMMRDQPVCFLALFPLSAAFWWFFEFLNRFVQNWYYCNISNFSSLEYVLFASLSFSTVLPAVLCTRQLIETFRIVARAFAHAKAICLPRPRTAAMICLLVSGIGLGLLGVFPDQLFPLVWVAPAVIIISFQTIAKKPHVFSPVSHGDWQFVAAAAFSALVCGFFWELWNAGSYAKWEYSVPYVQAAHIFEMPLLGYAGYLPFGLECAVLGKILEGLLVKTGYV